MKTNFHYINNLLLLTTKSGEPLPGGAQQGFRARLKSSKLARMESLDTAVQSVETHHDLSLDRIDNRPTVRSFRLVHLYCPRGRLEGNYYMTQASSKAVVFVGGLGERQDSPAANLYAHLGEDLAHRRAAALRLKVRKPLSVEETVYDLRLALRFLAHEGRGEFAVAGYGDAGPAAVKLALLEPSVTAVALLASRPGLDDVTALGSRCRVLMVHGGRDEITRVSDVKPFYDRFSDPKELLVLPRTTHTLNENSTEVHLRMRDWLSAWLRA